MKRIMMLILVLVLGGVSIAWAGKEAYKLVMSTDKNLCENVFAILNADIARYGKLRIEEHEAFQKISWTPVQLSGNQPAYFRYCSELQRAVFDIDNNGADDLVVLSSSCLRGEPIDSLYIFPKDSDVLIKATWQDMRPIFETAEKFDGLGEPYLLKELTSGQKQEEIASIGGLTKIKPFSWSNAFYVLITDLYPSEWVGIAKYMGKGKFQDICYFQKN